MKIRMKALLPFLLLILVIESYGSENAIDKVGIKITDYIMNTKKDKKTTANITYFHAFTAVNSLVIGYMTYYRKSSLRTAGALYFAINSAMHGAIVAILYQNVVSGTPLKAKADYISVMTSIIKTEPSIFWQSTCNNYLSVAPYHLLLPCSMGKVIGESYKKK